MAALAAFLQSDSGRVFASVNQGVDIGSHFPDDFLAYNARAALMWIHMEDAKKEETDDRDSFKDWVEANS